MCFVRQHFGLGTTRAFTFLAADFFNLGGRGGDESVFLFLDLVAQAAAKFGDGMMGRDEAHDDPVATARSPRKLESHFTFPREPTRQVVAMAWPDRFARGCFAGYSFPPSVATAPNNFVRR